MRRAAIDVGSNSVRLLLAEVDSSGEITSKAKCVNTTRIAEGLESTGRLTDAAMARSRQAVLEYMQHAKEWGAAMPVFCYATSAVREAENGRDFMAMLAGVPGMDARVISGAVEAECAYIGAAAGGYPVLDVGGASSELIWASDSCRSVRMGCVTVSEKFVHTDPIAVADRAAMDAYCRDTAQPLFKGAEYPALVGVGGTATQLAMLSLKLDAYDPDRVDGHSMTVDEIYGLYESLSAKTISGIKAMPGMDSRRADVILAGTAIIHAAMAVCGAATLYTSDGDGLEGYLRLRLSGSGGDNVWPDGQ